MRTLRHAIGESNELQVDQGVGTASLGLACVLGRLPRKLIFAAVLIDVKRFEIVGQKPASAGELRSYCAPPGEPRAIQDWRRLGGPSKQELCDQGMPLSVIIPAQKGPTIRPRSSVSALVRWQ